MKLSAPAYRLKRQARQLSRENDIPLHQALDRIARQEGYASWSLLAARLAKRSPASRLLAGFQPGDLVLLAARPGHGKTQLGLEIAVEAATAGRHAVFFTLEYAAHDIERLFDGIGCDRPSTGDRLGLDTSDEISGDYIVERLSSLPAPAVAVIDYLQLLDQDRSKPELDRQLSRLEAYARESGTILVLLSQVDRRFESKPGGMPGLDDIRQPNAIDLGRFTRTCFLNDGEMRVG